VPSIPSLGPRGEGWVVLQFACLALVGIAGRVTSAASGSPLGELARWTGEAAVLAGVALVAGALIELRRGDAFTALPHPRAGGRLVETGPYRFVRHPVYAGLILAALGWAIWRISVLAVLAAALLAVVLDLKRRREEAWLAARFPEYRAYRERTKALVPFVY
jgi:protein-S-isoprenylcysteine O-methyltransferase Ste14